MTHQGSDADATRKSTETQMEPGAPSAGLHVPLGTMPDATPRRAVHHQGMPADPTRVASRDPAGFPQASADDPGWTAVVFTRSLDSCPERPHFTWSSPAGAWPPSS